MALSPEVLEQIDQLPEDWELLPVSCANGLKKPVDPRTGSGLSRWEHLQYEREEFASMNGHVNAVGVKLGRFSGGLLQLDFDGVKSEKKPGNNKGCDHFIAFEQATGRPVTDLPETVAWTSGRGWTEAERSFGIPDPTNGNARFSLAFIIPMEFWDQMPFHRRWPDNMTAKCLEARFGGINDDGTNKGAQAVVLGAHPETAGYFWIKSPTDVEVAEAPEWLIDAILTPEAAPEPEAQAIPDAQRADRPGNTSTPFDKLPPDKQLEVVREALEHCTPRGPAGSGTYPVAFDVLCGLVHGLGKASATVLAEEWSPSRINDGWDLAHKIRDISKQTKGKRKTIGTVFWYAKQGGWQPPACFKEQPFTLNREDALAILERAVKDGVSPTALTAIQAELIELSPLSGATIHHAVLAVREEIEQDEAAEDLAAHQKRLATVSQLQSEITLEAILPPHLVGALRIINRYQDWPDTLMLSTLLSTSSGLLKVGTRVLADPLQGYSVPMNLFHAVVGKSGRGKTPLDQQLISRPISGLVAAMARENSRRHEAWWDANKDVAATKRDPRPQPRYVTIQDYSGEKLTEVLSVHDRDRLGLLVRVDELAGLFKRLNQYRGGSGGDEEQLLELWDGDSHQSVRIGGDRSYSASHVSITGGIQDEILIQLLTAGDGGNGRWARFLFSPLPPRQRQPRNLDPSEEELEEREMADDFIKGLAEYLYSLSPKVYPLTRDGLKIFDQFDIKRAEETELATLPSHAALLGKSSAKVLRIAGLLHLIHSFQELKADPDPKIDPQRVLDAIQLVEYFDAWAMSFHTLAASPRAAEADALLRSLHRNALKSSGPTSWSELRRQLAPTKRKGLNAKQGRDLLLQLEELGLGSISDGKAGAVRFQANGKPFPV